MLKAKLIYLFIYLFFFPVFCQTGAIRLVGGTSVNEGRVEVCVNETWGTVCDQMWGQNDANVACRQLGFQPSNSTPIYNGMFGVGAGRIWLNNLLCSGSEGRLVDCPHAGLGESTGCMGHSDDAGVRCFEGRVTYLPFPVFLSISSHSSFYSLFRPSLSLSILHFPPSTSPFSFPPCLLFSSPPSFNHILLLSGCISGQVRLVGGSLASEGRVEVCVDQQWGTVCDDSFSSTDASVVCKQLGFSRLSKLDSQLHVHK